MIELSQLGSIALDEKNKLFIHKDFLSYKNLSPEIAAQIDDLVSNLKGECFTFFF